jgi:hypothetical protein
VTHEQAPARSDANTRALERDAAEAGAGADIEAERGEAVPPSDSESGGDAAENG